MALALEQAGELEAEEAERVDRAAGARRAAALAGLGLALAGALALWGLSRRDAS
jgi:hypothetical protein